MKLPVSQVIKRLRNERNITQEELASFLGVTCQSVSRWENGVAYPDVEFFPLIASYFAISTDVLFGTDEVTRKFKMQEYLSGIKELENIIDNKKFKMLESLLQAAIADFPENIYFNWKLCSLYWRMGLEYAKENLNTMRKCAQFVIENDKSVDGIYRIGCIRVMIRVEEDDKLGNWTKYVSDSFDTSLPSIMASRFKYRKEAENYNEQIQKNLRDSLKDTFLRDFGKIDKNGNPKPASRTAGQRTILSIIDSMRDTSVEKDAWLAERAFAYLRLSSGFFGERKPKEAYAALEKSLDLYEILFALPESAELKYNSDVFDLLTWKKENFNGQNVKNELLSCLESDGWETFEPYRSENRFGICIERAKAL